MLLNLVAKINFLWTVPCSFSLDVILLLMFVAEKVLLLLVISLTVQAQFKENTKVPHHWPLWGEFTGHRWNSPHKGPITRKMFPFDDVIMIIEFQYDMLQGITYIRHGPWSSTDFHNTNQMLLRLHHTLYMSGDFCNPNTPLTNQSIQWTTGKFLTGSLSNGQHFKLFATSNLLYLECVPSILLVVCTLLSCV